MNLELITTDDLIDELTRRHEHTVFIGTKRIRKNKYETIRYFNGNHHVLLGLCAEVSNAVLIDLEDDFQDY